MNASENQIVVYQPNETVRLDVRLENETVWLTQAQLCELFQRDVSVISRHIKNIFEEGELEKESNLHFLQIAISDRPVAFYSLDVIISVGYRVKSVVGTRFRQWANKVLKEYILRGYAINDRIERLEQKVLKHDEQINLVLQTALPPTSGRVLRRAAVGRPGAGNETRRKREGGSMKFNSGEVGRIKRSAFAEDVNARSLV